MIGRLYKKIYIKRIILTMYSAITFNLRLLGYLTMKKNWKIVTLTIFYKNLMALVCTKQNSWNLWMMCAISSYYVGIHIACEAYSVNALLGICRVTSERWLFPCTRTSNALCAFINQRNHFATYRDMLLIETWYVF